MLVFKNPQKPALKAPNKAYPGLADLSWGGGGVGAPLTSMGEWVGEKRNVFFPHLANAYWGRQQVSSSRQVI